MLLPDTVEAMKHWWPTRWVGTPTRVFLVCAGAAFTISAWWSLAESPSQPRTVLSLPILIVGALAFLVHPKFKDRALAVIAVAFSAALLDPALFEPFIAGPAVAYAAYLSAAHAHRRFLKLWLAWLLVGVAVGVGRTLSAAQVDFEETATGMPFLLGALAMSLVAWCVVGFFWRLGLDTRRRRHAMATLEQRAELAAITERNRIAREMHDIVAHSLTGIMTLADGARFAAATKPAIAVETLETISDETRRALGQMRGLLSVLREDTGRTPTSSPGIEGIATLIAEARRKGLALDVEGLDSLPPLPELTEFTLYRVCQEMLTNMLRHAAQPQGTLTFAYNRNTLAVTATNPGAHKPREGLGLTGMRERAKAHEGTMRTSFEGDTFSVTVEIPA